MNKWEQIVKLSQAAQLIQEVELHVDRKFRDDLIEAADMLADVADQIEGFEEEA